MIDKGDPLFQNVHKILDQKDGHNLKKVYDLAISDRNFFEELMDGLTSPNEIYRHNCFKVIQTMSREVPLKLYSEWEYFHELINTSNAFYQMIGVKILANLTVVDSDEKFDEMLDEYFMLLDSRSLITARYVAGAAGIIVQAKPELQSRITEWLLKSGKTHHKNKGLVVHDAIESIDSYFDLIINKEKIISFVKTFLNSDSPKLANLAAEFLEKHSRS